jgi:hypothetical protein
MCPCGEENFMAQLNETVCSHCFALVPTIGAVYGDHNRRYCSDGCARAQLDWETGEPSPVTAARRRSV